MINHGLFEARLTSFTTRLVAFFLLLELSRIMDNETCPSKWSALCKMINQLIGESEALGPYPTIDHSILEGFGQPLHVN